jgi:outer membrane protein
MRALYVATILTLGAASYASAQTPPAGQSATPSAPPAQPAAAPQPPKPFPEGAKIAYVNVQRIANESTEGKVSTGKVQELNKKKVAELNEKNKALQAAEQKLLQSGTVLSDVARDQLEKDVEKQKRDIQRFTQDAQTEVQDLQQELQEAFQRRLFPIIQDIANEKGLHMIISPEPPIVWADPGLDITNEVIKRLDASPAASAPPAAAPAAPAAKPAASKPPAQ